MSTTASATGVHGAKHAPETMYDSGQRRVTASCRMTPMMSAAPHAASTATGTSAHRMPCMGRIRAGILWSESDEPTVTLRRHALTERDDSPARVTAADAPRSYGRRHAVLQVRS